MSAGGGKTGLSRPLNPMPADVAQRLDEENLRTAYDARPPYQRNDWLGWFARARQPQTRERRLAAMLAELRAGEGYMGMPWKPRDRK